MSLGIGLGIGLLGGDLGPAPVGGALAATLADATLSATGYARDLTTSLHLKVDAQAADVSKNGSQQIASFTNLEGTTARNLAQSTNNNKPVWSGAVLNGYDVAILDNSVNAKRAFNTAQAGNLTELAFTLAMVLKVDTTPGAGTARAVFQHSRDTGAGGFALELFGTAWRLKFISSASAVSSVTMGTIPTGTWVKLVITASASADDAAATIECLVNGVSQTITGSANYSTIDANTQLLLGNTGTDNAFTLAELQYWRRGLTTAEKAALNAIWGAKYNL